MGVYAEWSRDEDESWTRTARSGMLRAALLFGSAGVALALILTPIAERKSRSYAFAGVDLMSTGTVAKQRQGTYTIRRSVLQTHPDELCIIRANGSRSGVC
ncbi:hypothetical protein [Nitratireductor basaltis]|uniref:Transmembrane protein n=1 Tax=Nitratireductor basaltis TaxID=472175 RepID=A0A084U7N5_9HYPH|nr:hypothetical protein [Nitratireductor basaltis]KFB08971.1 hypothetical protein EL18_03228 [Nitratireductor basaltis]